MKKFNFVISILATGTDFNRDSLIGNSPRTDSFVRGFNGSVIETAGADNEENNGK